MRDDIRYGLRIFRRSPGFTAIVVLTLALGIGANTAIFSIVHAVLLRPLPYRNAERLVAVWDTAIHDKGNSKLFAPYRDFIAWKNVSRSFDQLAAATWATSAKIMTGRGPSRNVLAIPATVDFFDLLGVPPAMGRTFAPDDLTRGCTVVLAHTFWTSIGGADPLVRGRPPGRPLQDREMLKTGQALRLNNQSCTVIGVMPPGFAFYPDATAMWMLITPDSDMAKTPDRAGAGVFGRLKPGVTIAAALSELKLLHRQEHQSERHGAELEPVVYPLQEEFTWLTGRNLRLSLIVLFAAVGFVLLIACVNVANLLLGRSLVRQRELAIRASLGSGRRRLLRQLLTEALLLSSLAAALGALGAIAAIRYFRSVNPIELPPGSAVGISIPVLTFTAALAIVTTVLFGFLPAWKASRIDLNSVLKAGGRTGSHGRGLRRVAQGLVVVEVVLSLVLSVGAGLLIESVANFSSVPLAFAPDRIMTMSLSLPPAVYSQPEKRARFYREVADSVRALPEVQGLALATFLPLRSIQGFSILSIAGRPDPAPDAALHDTGQGSVTPAYFQTIGIPLKQGREFGSQDRKESEPVAIINEALAERYFSHESPVGKHIRFLGEPDPNNPWVTIVGVVANEKRSTVYNEMSWVETPTVYRPIDQSIPGGTDDRRLSSVILLIRTAANRPGLAAAAQTQIAKLDPGVPVGDIKTVRQIVSGYAAFPRFRAVLLGAFAGLALLLAVVGIYGVLAQLVTQRTQEIGVRMAIGAQRTDVLLMIVKQGMSLTAIGVVVGLAAIWPLTRFLAALLYGVGTTDPVTLGAVSAALIVAGFLAAYFPARRATKVDPMVALRYE